MPDKDGNRSNPYKPNPEKCCEACIFGSGEHRSFCAYSFPGSPYWPLPAVPWPYDGDRLSGSPPTGDISSVKHA